MNGMRSACVAERLYGRKAASQASTDETQPARMRRGAPPHALSTASAPRTVSRAVMPLT